MLISMPLSQTTQHNFSGSICLFYPWCLEMLRCSLIVAVITMFLELCSRHHVLLSLQPSRCSSIFAAVMRFLDLCSRHHVPWSLQSSRCSLIIATVTMFIDHCSRHHIPWSLQPSPCSLIFAAVTRFLELCSRSEAPWSLAFCSRLAGVWGKQRAGRLASTAPAGGNNRDRQRGNR